MLFFPYRVTGVVHQVDDCPAEILRNQIHLFEVRIIFLMNRHVEIG